MLVEMAKYLSTCPELSDRQVCVNYLDKDEGAVSLWISGSRESVREYADGGKMQGVTYTLSIRAGFGISQPENQNFLGSCERIEKWFEEQNLCGNLPMLGGSFEAVSVGIKKRFKIAETKDFFARYEAQIELIYINQV